MLPTHIYGMAHGIYDPSPALWEKILQGPAAKLEGYSSIPKLEGNLEKKKKKRQKWKSRRRVKLQ